jgi:tungstate transport system substrate-binding protein
VNVYHALAAPPGKTEGGAVAEAFIAFVAAPEGQRIIREYGCGQYSEALYNDAEYARKFD